MSAVDVETPAGPETAKGGGEREVSSVVNRWRREDRIDKSLVVLRGITCLLSLISALVMATNKHGDWKNFDHYEEYRYIVAIGFLSFLYSLGQLLRFALGRDFLPKNLAGIVDFAGDQIVAYLLMSALSASIPLTNRMREGADNVFTDASSASISMAFFAFAAIAISAMVSGYRLSKQNYI